MTSQSLYRKWRSRTFSDLLGQDHIVQTLRNAVKLDRIAHAYLFTGPRGTGKTSMARVMAKAVNCLDPQDGGPCGMCSLCLAIGEGRSPDVIEIDAASTGLVDDIRQLRERVAYTPTEGRFKVYIIDEVHRLGPGAFEALLKTVEEPPPHVLFIFASTEPHKIPMTILSRCQRFDFHKIDRATTITRVKEVATEEGMSIDDGASLLISQQAGGSLRDALGMLDQVRAFAGDVVTAEDVRSGIGLGRPEVVARLSTAMVSNDPGTALGIIHEATKQGIDPRTLSRQLVEYWRELLLYTSGSHADDTLDPVLADIARAHASELNPEMVLGVLRALTEEVIEPRLSVSPELPLEIGVVQAILNLHRAEASHAGGHGPNSSPNPERAVRETPSTAAEQVVDGPPELSPVEGESSDSETAVAEPSGSSPIPASEEQETQPELSDTERSVEDNGAGTTDLSVRLNERWPLVLETAGSRSKTLQGLLRGVEQKIVVDSEVTLGFKYPFHRDQSDRPENRSTTEKIIEEVVGTRLRVRCVTVSSASPPASDDIDAFVAEAERRLRGLHAQQYRTSRPDSQT